MTKPTIICFAFDATPQRPKVFLRTLLYSTSVKGKVIEGMYVKLRTQATEQVFSFWGYDESKNLVPGSGLYVGQTGFAANHHFVLPMDCERYEFLAGDYSVEIFARLVGQARPISLTKVELKVTQEQAAALAQRKGVAFEFGPDTQGYIGHISERPA